MRTRNLETFTLSGYCVIQERKSESFARVEAKFSKKYDKNEVK